MEAGVDGRKREGRESGEKKGKGKVERRDGKWGEKVRELEREREDGARRKSGKEKSSKTRGESERQRKEGVG